MAKKGTVSNVPPQSECAGVCNSEDTLEVKLGFDVLVEPAALGLLWASVLSPCPVADLPKPEAWSPGTEFGFGSNSGDRYE